MYTRTSEIINDKEGSDNNNSIGKKKRPILQKIKIKIKIK